MALISISVGLFCGSRRSRRRRPDLPARLALSLMIYTPVRR